MLRRMEEMGNRWYSKLLKRPDVISAFLGLVVLILVNRLSVNDQIPDVFQHSLNLFSVFLISAYPLYAVFQSKMAFPIRLVLTGGVFLLALHEFLQLVRIASPDALILTLLDFQKSRPFILVFGFSLYGLSMYFALMSVSKTQAALYSERQFLTREIADRKQAEEALREREETYRALVAGLPDVVMRLDRGGRVLFVSDNIHDVVDVHPSRFIGRTFRELGLPKAQSKFAEKAIQDVFESGAPFETEFTYKGKKGVTVHNWRLVPERDAQGVVKSVLSIGRDVTDHRRAEGEKTKLQNQLNESQKMESVGRLAGGVAHDFNNMIGVILGNAEMALEQVDPSLPLHDDLEEIRRAAERSADLTRQLLAFARRQTVAPKVLNLNETVSGMLKMLERLIGEHIELNWHPYADLWPIKVDPSQIDQVLANLCVNARDAIADVGKITIETGNCTLDDSYCEDHMGFVPGEYVRLVVSDDGCGMDEETQSHIFEPFFTTKGVGEGTGLGLSTVYGTVKQNDGFINVHSELGQGTTFTIHLPRYVSKKGPARTETPEGPLTRGRETILLVEDEPSILKMTAKMLEKMGYIVLAANTPADALRLAHEHAEEIHLLLTDVVMPAMNGRDLAKSLLSLYPGLKCVFMSGYTGDVIVHHGVLEEGVHFIQKPFIARDLAAKVREALDDTEE